MMLLDRRGVRWSPFGCWDLLVMEMSVLWRLWSISACFIDIYLQCFSNLDMCAAVSRSLDNKLTSSNIPSGNRGSVSPRDKRTGSRVRATYEGKLTLFRGFCNFGSAFSAAVLSNPEKRRRSSALPPSAKYNLK